MSSTITATGPGAQSFIRMGGEINPLGQTVQRITRAQVDGVAFRKMGKRARPSRLLTMQDIAAGAGAVQTRLALYKTYIGLLATIVDDLGDSTTNVMVINVLPVISAKLTGAVAGGTLAGSGAWLLTAEWIVQLTEVP